MSVRFVVEFTSFLNKSSKIFFRNKTFSKIKWIVPVWEGIYWNWHPSKTIVNLRSLLYLRVKLSCFSIVLQLDLNETGVGSVKKYQYIVS